MLMRFFLVLLFAAFALPAAAPAACHGKSTAAPHAMPAMAGAPTEGMGQEADHKAIAPHGCIGCIPPSAWTAAQIDDVPPVAAAVPVERAAVFDIGMTAAPALPPPRTA
jgi:hypothetical protein